VRVAGLFSFCVFFEQACLTYCWPRLPILFCCFSSLKFAAPSLSVPTALIVALNACNQGSENIAFTLSVFEVGAVFLATPCFELALARWRRAGTTVPFHARKRKAS
jgi:hypothetical protein